MTTRTAQAHQTSDRNDDIKVLIAGAGIGGLTLALALAKHNIRSHVIERREEFAPEGAGIQIGPNGARILIALGLEPAICAFAGRPKEIVPRDGITGTVLARMPVGHGNNPRHRAPYWTMHRANLHSTLLAAAYDSPHVRLTTAAEVLRAEQHPDGVSITLADKSIEHGEVFVAADGIHSRFRKLWASDAPLISIGKCAARTVIPAAEVPRELEPENVGIWLSPGTHVVHYPVRAGKDIAVVAIFDDDERSPDWTTPVSHDWVTSRCTPLHTSAQPILQKGKGWQKWSLASAPTLKKWGSGRVTLLGDAAHPTLPFLAQGAVMAMEDGVVLADQLAGIQPEDVPSALRRYELLRQPRTHQVAAASKRNGKIYHYSGLGAQVRNKTMQLLGGKALIHKYNWLYDW